MDVWKEIRAEAWRQMRESGFLEWKRLSVSVGIPIVSGFIQWEAGVTLPMNLAVNLGGGLALYTILVFVERYVRMHAIVEKRDADWRASVRDRDETIAQLKAPKEVLFRAQIQSFDIRGANFVIGRLEISLVLEIKSLNAPPVTMHDFKLCLLDERGLFARDGGKMSVVTGDIARRRLQFELAGIGQERATEIRKASEWRVTFKDVHDNPYETPVFKYSA